MKISRETRYPHPVLSEDTADYTRGDFTVQLQVSESKRSPSVTFDYLVELTEPKMAKLVEAGKAKAGVFIVSRRTYYNELHPLKLGRGRLEFGKGELRDTVHFRPIIYAHSEIEGFNSDNLHPEFGDQGWEFEPADVLALGAEIVIDVGLDKLAPIETIFELVRQPDVPPGQTIVQLDSDRIAICASRDTYEGIYLLRGSRSGQLALLNGVYLPAVMEVLAAVSGSPDEHAHLRWYSVFAAKCTHLNIALENPDVHEDAQTLLNSPLGTLLDSKEFTAS